MIFITKIELKNFQSHKDTTIEFHRGLNVILGHSDSGKTAILRAIKWALYNEPLGDYFIKQGEKDVSVSIEFNTGAIVKRYRSASKNTYYLKRADGEEYTFDGFGQKVPQEISEEIKMYKINLDEKSSSIINISEQLDGPFLLNEKPSLRASGIGRLVGVNLIDDALRETIRDKKQITSSLKSLEDEKKELKIKLEEFSNLEKEELVLNELIDIRTSLQIKKEKLDYMKKIDFKLKNNLVEIANEKNILDKYKDIDLLEEYLNNLKSLIIQEKSISLKNQLFKNYNKEITEKNILKNKLSTIDDLSKYILKLEDSTYKLNRLSLIKTKFNEIFKNLEKTSQSLKIYESLNNVEILSSNLEKTIKRYNYIYSLNTNYNKTSNNINIGNRYLKNFETLELTESIVQELNLKVFNYNKLTDFSKILIELNNNKMKIEESISIFNKDINLNLENYNNLLSSLGYCPMCMTKVDKNTMDHIEKHFKE